MHVSLDRLNNRLNLRFERNVDDDGVWYFSECTIFKLYKVVKHLKFFLLKILYVCCTMFIRSVFVNENEKLQYEML